MHIVLVKTAVRGYHAFQVVWKLQHGSTFVAVQQENSNRYERYATAVYSREAPGVIDSWTFALVYTQGKHLQLHKVSEMLHV